MTKYKRTLAKKIALDTQQIRAAINFIDAINEKGNSASRIENALVEDFLGVFGGADPIDIWGSTPPGFKLKKGRPPDKGFNPADIVSSFIELKRRHLLSEGHTKNALQQAKDLALTEFEDLQGLEDPERVVDRDWSAGKLQAQALDTEDLEAIIHRNEIN